MSTFSWVSWDSTNEERRRLRVVGSALDLVEWPGILRVIPGMSEWPSHPSHHMPRKLEIRFAVLVGTILDMRDLILDALERGRAPVREAVSLWGEGRARECAGMAHIYDYNNQHNDARVKGWVDDLIWKASEDAFTAFWWIAPLGAADRNELDLLRLQRTTNNVRTLNELLKNGPWEKRDREKYSRIAAIINQVSAYIAHSTAHQAQPTLAHQFQIAFARFIVTHDNNNKLPANRAEDQSHRNELEGYMEHQDELARLDNVASFNLGDGQSDPASHAHFLPSHWTPSIKRTDQFQLSTLP